MKATVTCLALWFTALLACASGEKVSLIKINGAIGPATASYISRSIGEAQSQNAQCLIIQLNTPGGLLDSTQVIVQQLLASPVPSSSMSLRQVRLRRVPAASSRSQRASPRWHRRPPLVPRIP